MEQTTPGGSWSNICQRLPGHSSSGSEADAAHCNSSMPLERWGGFLLALEKLLHLAQLHFMKSPVSMDKSTYSSFFWSCTIEDWILKMVPVLIYNLTSEHVQRKTSIWTYSGLKWHLIHHILDAKNIIEYGFTHESIFNLLVITYKMNKHHCFLFGLQH